MGCIIALKFKGDSSQDVINQMKVFIAEHESKGTVTEFFDLKALEKQTEQAMKVVAETAVEEAKKVKKSSDTKSVKPAAETLTETPASEEVKSETAGDIVAPEGLTFSTVTTMMRDLKVGLTALNLPEDEIAKIQKNCYKSIDPAMNAMSNMRDKDEYKQHLPAFFVNLAKALKEHNIQSEKFKF